MERTVKDVTPALETNSEGLKKVLEELVKQYKRQQDDMEKWKVSCLPFEHQSHLPLAYRTRLEPITEPRYGTYLGQVLMSLHMTQKKNNIQVVQQ